MIRLRSAEPADASVVADVYLASFAAALPKVRHGHSDDEIRRYIRSVIERGDECWVAVDGDDIVAMMFLKPGWIDQLYVAPGRLGEGIGQRLVALAKQRCDGELQLWTFQANERARRFYERNGFRQVELTGGSRNEEREPDVRYVWRAEDAANATDAAASGAG